MTRCGTSGITGLFHPSSAIVDATLTRPPKQALKRPALGSRKRASAANLLRWVPKMIVGLKSFFYLTSPHEIKTEDVSNFWTLDRGSNEDKLAPIQDTTIHRIYTQTVIRPLTSALVSSGLRCLFRRSKFEVWIHFQFCSKKKLLRFRHMPTTPCTEITQSRIRGDS